MSSHFKEQILALALRLYRKIKAFFLQERWCAEIENNTLYLRRLRFSRIKTFTIECAANEIENGIIVDIEAVLQRIESQFPLKKWPKPINLRWQLPENTFFSYCFPYPYPKTVNEIKLQKEIISRLQADIALPFEQSFFNYRFSCAKTKLIYLSLIQKAKVLDKIALSESLDSNLLCFYNPRLIDKDAFFSSQKKAHINGDFIDYYCNGLTLKNLTLKKVIVMFWLRVVFYVIFLYLLLSTLQTIGLDKQQVKAITHIKEAIAQQEQLYQQKNNVTIKDTAQKSYYNSIRLQQQKIYQKHLALINKPPRYSRIKRLEWFAQEQMVVLELDTYNLNYLYQWLQKFPNAKIEKIQYQDALWRATIHFSAPVSASHHA